MTIDCQLHQAYLGYLSELNKKSGAHWRWGVLIRGWDIPPTTMAHSSVTFGSSLSILKAIELGMGLNVFKTSNQLWNTILKRFSSCFLAQLGITLESLY